MQEVFYFSIEAVVLFLAQFCQDAACAFRVEKRNMQTVCSVSGSLIN